MHIRRLLNLVVRADAPASAPLVTMLHYESTLLTGIHF
jgi:hypothetical protein